MDKTSKKIYAKAMKLYQNGYIDKALEVCEKGISEDLKNAPIINLKGMLLYIKGDLRGAISLWQINKDVSNDLVAKKYVDDSIADKEREILYKKALKLLKELKISEAIDVLNQCEKSSFNSINVYNALSLCYIKKGDYEKSLEYVEKSLSIDKKNPSALQNKKILREYGATKKEIPYKGIALCLISIVALALFTLGIKNYIYPISKNKIQQVILDYKNGKNEENINKEENQIKDTNAVEVLKVNEEEEQKEENPKENPMEFPSEEFKMAIENKDFEKIYSLSMTWRESNLTLNEKNVFAKGESLMVEEGIDYFYKLGGSYLASNDNKNAQDSFLKAYSYSKNSYLNPHIIYSLATNYEKEGNVEEAIKYYEEYMKLYSEQNYADLVLYNMVMIYKNVEKEKAKECAIRLRDKYPKSIYYNSNIKEILKD
ncbi:tetratricopeptide repeat protein [Clostridium sp. MSJ-4]|uniref:Tetratricopeptide repeat protein n=1 Tax=Clostridium simiarum TaxID=2841506 RepID=A0ABS6F1L8_9CLOT|nr:tetratricopeptide repeat protein [Clostridium simiarum]MBU5591800.1 tetratricopeptide repeat protein [Clostridium simiarum]